MGNRPSINIHLDKEVYQAGKPLTGRVVLEIHKPFKKWGSLDLQVVGKEKAMMGYRQICQVHLTLQKFEGKIDKGVYSFPFTIDLPASLPSTATCLPSTSTYGTPTDFRIEYKIIVGMRRTFQEEFPLRVTSAPLSSEPVRYMSQPASYPVKAAGIIDKGVISIGCSITNSHVGRGENLHLHLACRNDSTTDIQRIDIKFFEEIQWGKREEEVFILGPLGLGAMSKEKGRKLAKILAHLPDVSLPGLDKNHCSREDLLNNRADPTSQDAVYQQIYQDLVSGLNHIPLKVPGSARDTYKGQIVRISHYLEIKLKTIKRVTSPMIRIPIRVGTPAEKRIPFPSHEIPESNIHLPVQTFEVPIVPAVLLSTGTIYVPMATADPAVIVLGGDAVIRAESDDSMEQLADLEPMLPPQQLVGSGAVSLDDLLIEMARSINDFDILTERLNNSEWRQLLSGITADEFSSVILRVSDEFNQPRVAGLVAPYLNHGNFTCQYAAAAVRSSCKWNRSSVAQLLLPMCTDVATGFELIRDELNEWERTVAEHDFQAALAAAR